MQAGAAPPAFTSAADVVNLDRCACAARPAVPAPRAVRSARPHAACAACRLVKLFKYRALVTVRAVEDEMERQRVSGGATPWGALA